MSNEDGTVWITFNGEVYNFAELRRELEGRHQFRSQTDTEVLIHLYEEHGERMVDRLDGMFAFAIVDLKQQRVLLARDPLNQTPVLRVGRQAVGVRFRDKTLVGVRRSFAGDRSKRSERLLRFSMDSAPKSIFQCVRKLLPAHSLLLDLKSWETSIRRYWQPEYRPEEGRTLDSWADEVESVLAASVSRHMIADVPVGAFLSGGTDSSLVALYASQAAKNQLLTFTIDFEEQSFSEGPYAAGLAAVADECRV